MRYTIISWEFLLGGGGGVKYYVGHGSMMIHNPEVRPFRVSSKQKLELGLSLFELVRICPKNVTVQRVANVLRASV